MVAPDPALLWYRRSAACADCELAALCVRLWPPVAPALAERPCCSCCSCCWTRAEDANVTTLGARLGPAACELYADDLGDEGDAERGRL